MDSFREHNDTNLVILNNFASNFLGLEFLSAVFVFLTNSSLNRNSQKKKFPPQKNSYDSILSENYISTTLGEIYDTTLYSPHTCQYP